MDIFFLETLGKFVHFEDDNAFESFIKNRLKDNDLIKTGEKLWAKFFFEVGEHLSFLVSKRSRLVFVAGFLESKRGGFCKNITSDI